MRERRVLWVVLAAFVVGLVAVAGLAAVDDSSDGPPRLPALAAGAATAESSAAGASPAADMAMRIGPVEYRVAGTLPDLPDRASAWEVGAVGLDDARRLASRLGIDGDVVSQDEYGWTIDDGRRSVHVGATAGGPWTMGPREPGCGPDTAVSSSDDPAIARELEARCAATGEGSLSAGSGVAAPDATSSSGAAGATEPAAPPEKIEPCPMPDCPPGTACAQVCPEPTPEPLPEPLPEPERPADLPSKAEAERIGLDFLAEAGLDTGDADVRVEDGFSQWLVSAEPRVGGLPTQGIAWSAAVGPKGVVEYANGWLADPTEGDEYPLAGVDAGIERLKNGGGWGWSEYPAVDGGPAIAMESPECADCEPVVRTITGVRLGLLYSPVFTGDGVPRRALLVPSYFFSLDDGDFEQPVIAVADDYLPAPPEVPAVDGRPEPAPMPVEPDGGIGGSTGSAGCTGAASSDGMTVEVCGPEVVVAGEENDFTLRIIAPEKSFITAECAAPALLWGDDGGGRPVCTVGCDVYAADSPSATWERSFRHAYAEPGKYEVHPFIAPCGGATVPDVTFPVEVVAR